MFQSHNNNWLDIHMVSSISNSNQLYIIIWFQVFQTNTNNLYTIMLLKVFLSNNKLKAIIGFQIIV